MKKYVLSWSMTESDLQNHLESVSNMQNPVYSLVFDTEKEAFEAFQKELAATSLTKCSDLDFSPSDQEFRTNCCALFIAIVDDEDDMATEDIEASEFYWID